MMEDAGVEWVGSETVYLFVVALHRAWWCRESLRIGCCEIAAFIRLGLCVLVGDGFLLHYLVVPTLQDIPPGDLIPFLFQAFAFYLHLLADSATIQHFNLHHCIRGARALILFGRSFF